MFHRFNRNFNNKLNIQRPKINFQIRHSSVRVIDEKGTQLGVFPIEEAVKMAEEQGLDLVEITAKVSPPICKIINYGKYQYQQEKKKKKGLKAGQKTGEVKGIRIKFNTAKHDLEMRAKQAEEFLNEGNKVKIDMILRGREKAHQDLAKEKIKSLLDLITVEIIIDHESKQPKGLTMVISKKK